MLFSERLRRHAQARATQAALISPRGELNYCELESRVRNCARDLLKLDLTDSAVIGVSIEDEHDHFIASLALLVAGLRQVTLATSATPIARALLARKAGATHVLSDDAKYALDELSLLPWREINAVGDATPEDATPRTSGLLYLTATGTTGDANTIVFTEQQLAHQAERYAEYANERLLRLAPIEFNTSKRHRLYCFWQGGANVFRSVGPLASVTDLIERRNVTCLDVSHMHLAELVALDRRLPPRVKLRPGGAPVSAQLRQRVRAHVTENLYVRYAASECGAISMAGPSDHDQEANCGRVLTGVNLEIVDDDERVLAAGASGHVRVRAPGMAHAYLANATATAARFRDGWFYPGDVGYLRADGRLVLQGRADDVINLNGIKILPSEIEQVLEAHPSVAAAAAIALTSSVHGQIPVAAVELSTGADITPAALLAYARNQLSIKSPRKILVLPVLPRNEQGKILRREIRKAFGQP